MSSPPRVIFLDSNAYFRLARSIHPLLSQPFGDPPPYALKVIGDLDREFKRSHRLSSKFHWVSEKEYSVDREDSQYLARGKTATQVDKALSYLSYQAKVESIDVSYVDLKVHTGGVLRHWTLSLFIRFSPTLIQINHTTLSTRYQPSFIYLSG